MALDIALRKMEEWYLADGWYSDGPDFSLDYYNSFVIQPMIVEISEILTAKKIYSPIKSDLHSGVCNDTISYLNDLSPPPRQPSRQWDAL